MTGGALAWVNATWPEAAYASSHDVAYVAVAGRAVVGDQAADRQALAGYSHDSYKQARPGVVGVSGSVCLA